MPLPIINRNNELRIFGIPDVRKQMESSARRNAAMNLQREGVAIEGVNAAKQEITAGSDAYREKIAEQANMSAGGSDASERIAAVRAKEAELNRQARRRAEILRRFGAKEE